MFNEILILIVKSFWFILPAYAANMSPYAVMKIDFLSKPISKKYLGNNKTWRGFIFAVFIGMIVAYLQSFVQLPAEYLVYDYSNPLILGFFMGFGAMFGDALESFFKRRRNIKPGESWMPFDQIDFIFGAYVFSLFVVNVPIEILVVLVVITVPLHLIINYIGYSLKLKKNKF